MNTPLHSYIATRLHECAAHMREGQLDRALAPLNEAIALVPFLPAAMSDRACKLAEALACAGMERE